MFEFYASLSILKYESMDDHSADKEVSPGRESVIDDAKLVRALVSSTNSDPAEHEIRYGGTVCATSIAEECGKFRRRWSLSSTFGVLWPFHRTESNAPRFCSRRCSFHPTSL